MAAKNQRPAIRDFHGDVAAHVEASRRAARLSDRRRDPARTAGVGNSLAVHTLRRMILVEGGRHVARIVCRRCHWCAELPETALKGLRGPRLFRALVCSACGARDAEVSIRWECPPKRLSR
jgi:hypothetical protein